MVGREIEEKEEIYIECSKGEMKKERRTKEKGEREKRGKERERGGGGGQRR